MAVWQVDASVASCACGSRRPQRIVPYSNKRILIFRNERAARVPGLKIGTGVNFTLY